ncbi:nucleoside-diphosphate sugar epimerase [Rhizobium sp. Leaf384]|uniref:mitochondrial fission ELM1 family protein n=1 Tax=unclassified Rhizobium TaxID=2613769 RepID=UPI0007140536|nr:MULTISPECIES: ELM1/GtrOC1 family putative glycosyltransferase [unclassified Rhizobium]KQS75567.1 nucleoside-diphosphate sugar epimerase [Rhizobium sp. Leaf384]KQS75816.1 nucleoside-diphosphate sugar epimerase [Rhizobium sp. Leaf383]
MTEHPDRSAVLPSVRRGWAVTEEKAGTLTQCLGIARQIDPAPVVKIVTRPHGWRKWFKPRLFSTREAEPAFLVSCGFRAEEPVLAIKHAFGGRPFAVHLQRPRVDGYDLIFVSRHDWVPDLDGIGHVRQMVGVPHQITPERLAAYADSRSKYAEPTDRVAAVFLGGSNGAYLYDDACHLHIRDAVKGLEAAGWKVVITVSRRSSEETLQAALTLRSENITVWDRTGENPYLDFMASADAFLIAKDSITMPCEALVTGKPVYTLDLTPVPGERLLKFETYHTDLRETLNLTRAFKGDLAPYVYEPLNETKRIGAIVADALADRQIRGPRRISVSVKRQI